MKTITYKNKEINIKSTPTHKFLISNKDLADTCEVFEHLLNLTRELNPAMIYEKQHYVIIDGTYYWTKEGIIRIAILLMNCESIEFADFLETMEE